MQDSFTKNLLWLALPITAQSLIQSSLGIIDQLMVGQLGSTGMAMVGIGAKLSFLFLMIIQGLAGALAVLLGQSLGAGNNAMHIRSLRTAWLIGSAILAVFVLASTFAAQAIVSLFTTEQDIIAGGTRYLQATVFGFAPLMVTFFLSVQLRATGHAKLPFYTGLVSVGINTVLNYLLIFGNYGFPELGALGSAWATSCARLVEAILLAAITLRMKLPFGLSRKAAINKDVLLVFYSIAFPVFLIDMMWIASDTVTAILFGRMGADALSAIMTSYPIQSIVFSVAAGLSASAGVLLSRELGQGGLAAAHAHAKKVIYFSGIVVLLLGVTIPFAIKPYLALYDLPAHAMNLAYQINLSFAAVMFFKVVNVVLEEGILRSGGDSRYTVYAGAFATWLLAVPLALFGAYYLHMPLYLVYLALSLDEVCKWLLQLRRVKQGYWCRSLVATG